MIKLILHFLLKLCCLKHGFTTELKRINSGSAEGREDQYTGSPKQREQIEGVRTGEHPKSSEVSNPRSNLEAATSLNATASQEIFSKRGKGEVTASLLSL